MHPNLTFVLGGAASGKSAFAEQLVVSTDKNRVYVATSQVFDDEMRQKIRQHIAQRGTGWMTIEAPFDLKPALAGLSRDQISLIDCATMWLSNHLLAENDIAVAPGKVAIALAQQGVRRRQLRVVGRIFAISLFSLALEALGNVCAASPPSS